VVLALVLGVLHSSSFINSRGVVEAFVVARSC
jgi:hypothetical protein